MPVFGLTGSFSSGKTSVLKLLKKKGAVIFDADSNVHGYYKKINSVIYRKVVLNFPEALTKGVINRQALGKIVFSDTKKLKILEQIVHQEVIKELKLWSGKAKKSKKIYVAEVPLLFEKKLEKLFDAIILVYTPKNILVERIKSNSNLPRRIIESRLKLFKPDKDKIKNSEVIINNNLSLKALKKEVDILWHKLKK